MPAQTPQFRKEVALFSADMPVCAGSMALAAWLRFQGAAPVEHLILYVYTLPVILLWRLLMASSVGLYDFRTRLTLADHGFAAIGAALFGVGGTYVLLAVLQLYYQPIAELSRLVALIDFGIMVVWFTGSRAATLAWLRSTGRHVNVALVGPPHACENISAEIRRWAPDLVRLQGYVSPKPESGEKTRDENCLGDIDELETIVKRERIHQFILLEADLSQAMLWDTLYRGERAGADMYLYPQLDVAILTSTNVISLAGLPLISLRPAVEHHAYKLGKRLLDIALAVLILLLTLPVTMLTAVALGFAGGGSVLFQQDRVGRHGRVFRVFKFRTMVHEAEAATGPVLANPSDPRITPLGRLLRRTRIDEIPQLVNVLLGDMSLVGPRPERPEFVERFVAENPLYHRRHLLRPGLTGLAQIHGRYDTDYTHKLRYDLIYVNGVSLALDVRILFATVRTVLTGHGAV